MEMTCFIIDDFYQDPDSVRNFALNQEFSVRGNFPGTRTKPFLSPDIIQCIEYFMPWAGKITNTFEWSGYTGAFQLAVAGDRTWIHTDFYNKWAGVCYLTPDAPHTSGTGLYRYKPTGEHRKAACDYEGYDYTKWDLFDVIGNKYNRLVIYRGDLFHASLQYFGDNLHNGRLFQTFFFDTEK